MASRRQQRKNEKGRRHVPKPIRVSPRELDGPVERLVYSREQAAQALGVSLATLDRHVIPTIATVKTEWGARLIPRSELQRYLAERTENPRALRAQTTPPGRKSLLSPDLVDRIRHEHDHGTSFAEIARRLNNDRITTGQGGSRWWPSTVRDVILRRAP